MSDGITQMAVISSALMLSISTFCRPNKSVVVGGTGGEGRTLTRACNTNPHTDGAQGPKALFLHEP